MSKIKLVTVFINEVMYRSFFDLNSFLLQTEKVCIDNRGDNRSVTVIYNEVIEQEIDNDYWLFFVHEDFEIKSDLEAVTGMLDKNSIYGTFGVRMEHGVPVAYGKHICSNKWGGNAVIAGMNIEGPEVVETLDCQSILVHTSLLRVIKGLRFDEKLSFDLYAEDFSINASKRHGISIGVFPLVFQHYSHGKITQRYHDGLEYLRSKYPDVCVAGSCSFIGGACKKAESKFKYNIEANR